MRSIDIFLRWKKKRSFIIETFSRMEESSSARVENSVSDFIGLSFNACSWKAGSRVPVDANHYPRKINEFLSRYTDLPNRSNNIVCAGEMFCRHVATVREI